MAVASSGVAPLQPPVPGPKVVQSASDDRVYRVVTLSNQLRVLLIEEPELKVADGGSSKPSTPQKPPKSAGSVKPGKDEKESGAGSVDDGGEDDGGVRPAALALCVKVGSFSDPLELQGLAHFLEHMLFMGTKKFPGSFVSCIAASE